MANYFDDFCSEYKVTDSNNYIQAVYKLPGERPRKIKAPIFSETKDGDLAISVFTIDSNLIPVVNKNATPEKPNINNNRFDFYKVIRFQNPRTYTDPKTGKEKLQKYSFPGASETFPFFPPDLINKYQKQTKIDTLVLTEGYKKAWIGAVYGLDIVGLSSITHYKQKNTGAMYDDVLRLITACKVKNVILLHDSDCLDISDNALKYSEDLYTRPGGFFKAALTVRDLLKDYNVDFYFAHGNNPGPKGLDDILFQNPDKETDIVKSLTSLSKQPEYFYRENITTSHNKLLSHFAFNSVDIFYLRHQEKISKKEFVYHGTRYVHNEKTGRCDVKRPAQANDYFRVGDTYYKFVQIPNKYKTLERNFQARNKTTLIDDYGKDFPGHVDKYEAFCNVPSHTEFNQTIHNCFNVYSRFEHEPEEGQCNESLEFVRHIFEEQYEMGLDYIQLLYQQPTQILPILCLVSRENMTGKSTFVKWIKAIFTGNCTIVGNESFNDQFNGNWATKSIIACEESFIEKRQAMEKIKGLATGDKISLRMMQRDPVEIDFFGKFILCSNNEEHFILAGRNDTRYWVRKIKLPQKDNVMLLQNLIAEIPHFLWFLNNRKLSTQQESRMWFSPASIRTDAFESLVRSNYPLAEREIREYLVHLFIETRAEVISMPLNYIMDNILKRSKADISYAKKILQDIGVKRMVNEKGLYPIIRMNIPYIDSEGLINNTSVVGRPYIFLRKDFISDVELEKFDNQLNEELTI